MAVNTNPPVLIDPNMDEGHKDSFINQNFLNLANSLNPFIVSDGTGNILQLGKQTDNSYSLKFFDSSTGIGTAEFKSGSFKVAKSGFEVSTATNSQLIFNSAQNVFKIVSTGTTTTTASLTANASTTVTVPHNLGYTPIPFVYTGGGFLPQITNFGVSAGNIIFTLYIFAAADSTNMYIRFFSSQTATDVTRTFTYYLLQESAA